MKSMYLGLLVLLLFSACQDDPFNPSTNNNNTAATPTPNACQNADAALIAVRSLSKGPSVGGFPAPTITLGLAVGVFTSNGLPAAPPARVNVGTVEANGTTLEYEGETYLNKPGVADPQGINWSSSVNWTVSGDNGFPAFSHTPTNAFPTVTEVTSAATVTKSAGYTLTCDAVGQADSVLFLVGDVGFTKAGNATSHTFSAADLSSLSTGPNFVQIVPYTFSSRSYGSKNVCFINESVQQLAVEIE